MSKPAWLVQMRKGIAEMVVLSVIDQSPIHARGIYVHLTSFGTLSLSEGTLYPLLSRLKRQGFVLSKTRSTAGAPPKKIYSLTPSGRARLDLMVAQWSEIHAEFARLQGESTQET